MIEPAAPVALTPIQFLIWDAVRRSPHGLTAPALAARIYADRPDGGPEFARGCIYAAIRTANRRLRSAGIAIACNTGTRGGVYKIQQINNGGES